MLSAFFSTLGMISRIVVTRICFFLFGLGGLILGYMILPMIRCCTTNAIQKELNAQYMTSLTFRLFIFIIGTFGYVKFEFKNFECLDEDATQLMIANHPTLIDYVAIVSRLPHCYTMLKADASNNPFMAMVTAQMGYVSNSNPLKAYERIEQILSRGYKMLIFPEGTRTTRGAINKFQRGAAHIALKMKLPIRIIHIRCEPSFLTKQCKWYTMPRGRIYFRVEAGELVDIEPILRQNLPPQLAARRLTQVLERAYTHHAL